MRAVRGGRSGLLVAILVAASIMSVIPRLKGGGVHSACAPAHGRESGTLSFMCDVSSDSNPAAKLDRAQAHRESVLADAVLVLSIPAGQRILGLEYSPAPSRSFGLRLRISPARSDGEDLFI